LQNLLRTCVFSVFKISTKINPGDLNTKRLSGERRKFLGRLIGLFSPSDSETNDDNEIKRIRRINKVTMEQCMRLIQMAGASMNARMQLKGCSSDFSFHHGSVTGGDMDEPNSDGVQLVLWTLAK